MKGCFFCIIYLLTAPVHADDAAWTYVGGAGNFSHNDQIRMVSERVRLELRDKRSHVHADFTFRNEGPATTVTMAFPEESHQYPKHRAIDRLTSYVDGNRVPCTRKLLPESEAAHYSEYVAVWLKTVKFAANQTRHVSVDYFARNGDIGDYVQNGYILTTGATWKGKIGRVEIDVDWSSFHGRGEPWFEWEYGNRDHDANLAATGPRSGKIVITNVEPAGDLVIRWTNSFWNFNVNGESIDGTGYGNERNEIVWGSDSDPIIDLAWVPAVFGSTNLEGADQDQEPNVGNVFKAGRHTVRVLGRATVMIDGRRIHLRRHPRKKDEKGLYLRDLVRALGGTMRYSKSLDRVYIKV